MRELKFGDHGAHVEALQLALARAGFYKNTINGMFNDYTDVALRQFQASWGLISDGIAGSRSWARLMHYLTGYIVHTIVPNDTFYKVAKRYGTTLEAVITANPNMDAMNLQPGTRIIVPLGFMLTDKAISYSYDFLSLIIEGLTARYPFIRQNCIGESVLGKRLYCLSVGNGKTQIFYNASHHANEWITTPILMKYLEELAEAYSTNGVIYGEGAVKLLSDITLYMVPMVNPDGVDLVTDALDRSSTEYKRAKEISEYYPHIPFPSGWKANIDGVDLNLNYPANWELAKKVKFSQGFTEPGPRDFVGAEPLSEPESSSVRNFTVQHDFMLTLSYHSQGEVIFWKYLDYEPEGSYEIGKRLSLASGYELMLTPPESAYAGYKDWFIEKYNRPGYTIEVGRGINPLPISQFDDIYNKNKGLLTLAMKPFV